MPTPTDSTTPKYVVGDSPRTAALTTIFSLIFFGVTLFGALMRLASAHDLNAIRALLMRDDTIGWLTTVGTMLAPVFWIVWRTVKSWFKKVRDIELTGAVPNKLAMLKSEVAAAVNDPAPTRARETTTRLVGADAIGTLGLAPIQSPPMPPVAPPAPEPRIPVMAPGNKILLAPLLLGEADHIRVDASRPAADNDADFLDLYAEYGKAAASDPENDHGFRPFAESKGWAYIDGRWRNPTDTADRNAAAVAPPVAPAADTTPHIPGDALGSPPPAPSK
jgi:hypothetical protein